MGYERKKREVAKRCECLRCFTEKESETETTKTRQRGRSTVETEINRTGGTRKRDREMGQRQK